MLSKLRISQRIAIAVAVPLLGLLAIAATEVVSSLNNYRQMSFLVEVSDAVAELGELSHRLQVERGNSASFIRQGNSVPGEDLVGAREHVDAEVARLHDLTEHLKGRANEHLIHELEEIEKEVKALTDFRARVDAGEITADENLHHYSQVIHHVIQIGFHASGLSTDGKIAREIVAYVDLAEAKEFAAEERAIVIDALMSGEMTQDKFVKVSQLIAGQELLKEAFIANEPVEYRAEYEALIDNSGKVELEELRHLVSASWADISASGLDLALWRETATAHIDALRRIEKKVAETIHMDAEKIASEAFGSMVWTAVLSGIVLVIAVVAGFVMARSITNPLGTLTGAMDKVSSGDIEVEIEGRGRVDEIGTMARALQAFKDGSAEKAALEREAEKVRLENERAREQREAEKNRRDGEIRRAVDSLASGLAKLSAGDLTVNLGEPFIDELEQVRVDFNKSVSELCATFTDVQANIKGVFADASEMRSAADSLCERTEKQAASLEQTSAALEQLTANVKASSGNAAQAKEKAAGAKKNSDDSASVVSDAVSAMTRIESASQEIAQIISLIDEIAFQTNLLALNAGVEAARAGDAGQGFAVVAQEVRELAQRSAGAAQDIKNLIEKSSSEVEAGVRLVRATGDALQGIATDVDGVNEMIEAISNAAQEQSIGLGECNTAVSQMDRFTQHNAAMVEETTATTHHLSAEAEKLMRLVSRFTLDKQAKTGASQPCTLAA